MTNMLPQATQGLHHFVNHLNEYPASMQLLDNDELAILARASEILDRMDHRRETGARSLNTDWAYYERLEAEGVEATTTEDRPVVTSWWEIHDNVAFLATWMAEHGESAAAVAEMVETPWSFTEDFEVASDLHAMEIEQDTPNRKDTI